MTEDGRRQREKEGGGREGGTRERGREKEGEGKGRGKEKEGVYYILNGGAYYIRIISWTLILKAQGQQEKQKN